MCGRYGFGNAVKKDRDFDKFYGVSEPHKAIQPRFNIAPTQEAPIITRNSPNKVEFRPFGITAPWNEKMHLINAQAESVAEKRTYKHMFLESRCLIPAAFFFEWQKLADGKQPYAFAMKDDELFAFAGIFNDTGFVIITTGPNELMAPVHNRMPAILKKEDFDDWLNPDTVEDKLLEMLAPFPDNEMKKWPVSSLVNTPKHDIPEVLKTAAGQEALL